MTYRLVDTPEALADLPSHFSSPARIALDCEAAGFHRYSDRLCLVQLSIPGQTVLLDPLSADPSPTLKPLLEDPRVEVVMHGADYDVRLLDRDLGIRLKGLFDTQAAASLLGAPAVGLASLLEEHLGVKLSKKHQRADWAQRPLPPELLEYAAGDTEHLLPLRDLLWEKLKAMEREEWALEEFRLLEEIRWEEEEADPVTRVKGARLLAPRFVTALRAALEWRDRIARERDRAPFRVAGDQVLMEVIQESPSSVEELASVKGMSPRLAREEGRALLRELQRVEGMEEGSLVPYPRGNRNGHGRPTPEEEALADRIRTLRSGRAQTLGVERGVLLSNAQILEIVRQAPSSLEELKAVPGMRNWQAEVLGKEILGLLS